MDNFGTLFVVLLFGFGGYYLVSTLWDAFVTKKSPAGVDSDDPTVHYAKLLGVSAKPTVVELERALEKAIELYGPERVAHMPQELQQMAAIRLEQAKRAFDHLMALVR